MHGVPGDTDPEEPWAPWRSLGHSQPRAMMLLQEPEGSFRPHASPPLTPPRRPHLPGFPRFCRCTAGPCAPTPPVVMVPAGSGLRGSFSHYDFSNVNSAPSLLLPAQATWDLRCWTGLPASSCSNALPPPRGRVSFPGAAGGCLVPVSTSHRTRARGAILRAVPTRALMPGTWLSQGASDTLSTQPLASPKALTTLCTMFLLTGFSLCPLMGAP